MHDDQNSAYGSPSSDGGEHCGEAVMAAVSAINDHCEGAGRPVEMPNGVIVNVPDDAREEMGNMAPGSMSDNEVLDLVEASPWMSGIVDRNCSMAGLEEGSRQYDQCAINFARNLIDSV